MDRPHLTSPPSILVYDFNSNHQRRRSSSKSSSPSTTGQSLSPRGPMPVPGTNEPLAPPPLPPPRYIEDLANGHDSGWKWGNSFQDGGPGFGKSSTLAPIKPSSSLFGGHSRPALVRRNESFYLDDETRKSAVNSTMSSPKLEAKTGLSPPADAPFPGSLASSLSSPLAACSLQGEKPLSEKSVERSSNAYDQHLLSKIGKPSSPPRQSSRLSSVGTKETTTLPFHSKGRNAFPSLSIGESSSSPQDPVSRWNMGPPSAAISPGTRPGWSDYVSHSNPSVDSMAPTMDMETYVQPRDRRTGTWSRKASDDVGSLSSRSNRGSYDQGFPDSDADFSMDESGNYRSLHPENRRFGSLGSISPLSKQGMKRRASSPPRGAVAEGLPILRTTTSNGELDQRRGSGFPFNECASPVGLYPPSHGSVSSASSMSLRTGSYASSAGLSVGGSSITSMSSFDRLSPGGVSPISDIDPYYDRGAISPGSHKLLPATADSRAAQRRESGEGKGHGTMRDTSMGNTLTVPKPSAPRMSRMYICKCCHKKPKKFDNIEDLRAHEMEKQYTCNFCNKRFKNKNEAERHQNSLHLRRHSWSCAALSGYEAAFHPSSSASYQTPSGPSHDTCGYCGDEFTNYPQPEWDRRIDHLTNVHKFGECNQAKKFYRADHFRQHLKHSHAGASGKWTNILENACMKEEQQPGDANFSGMGEHGHRLSESSIPGDAMNPNREAGAAPISTMLSSTSHTIDEAMDES